MFDRKLAFFDQMLGMFDWCLLYMLVYLQVTRSINIKQI